MSDSIQNVNVKLVYGAGCSGKNTFVREHKQDGDLIIDFDALHQAISGLESHNHIQELFGYVLDARDALLKRLLDKGYSSCSIINSIVSSFYKLLISACSIVSSSSAA